MLTSVSDAAKKLTKSKEELNFERKQELEKRLQDVNDQLNPKESFKSNVALLLICNGNSLGFSLVRCLLGTFSSE